MRSIIIFIILSIFYSNPLPQGIIFFDVKTEFLEKGELAHIQAYAEYKIKRDLNWAGITEVTGDYQLWLVDYSKVKEDNLRSVSLTLELRKVKAFGKGELLKAVPLKIEYVLDADNSRAESEYEFYKKSLTNWSTELKIEAREVSSRIIEELSWLIREFETIH